MSDYSPPYTEEDQRRDQRRDKAVAKIRKMPAENLNVGDLLDIIEALHKYQHSMTDHDIKVIENILSNHRTDHHCNR